MGQIGIWVSPQDNDTSKGMLGERGAALLERFDPVALNASLSTLLNDLNVMLRDLPTGQALSLTSLEVAVEISAEAGINIIGTAKAAGKAALTLKLERS